MRYSKEKETVECE